MSNDLRSTIKQVVDEELAAHPAPLPDLRGRTIHAAAGRLHSRPAHRLRHLTVAAAVAVVIAALGTFLAIQVRFHPASSPAHHPTRPVTVVPSPSAGPTPTPSAVASAPPVAAGVRGTPPGDMRFPSAVYDPTGQRIVLFGSVLGQAAGTEQPPQTWVWQGDAWFKLSSATTPAPTWYQRAVTMGPDRAGHRRRRDAPDLVPRAGGSHLALGRARLDAAQPAPQPSRGDRGRPCLRPCPRTGGPVHAGPDLDVGRERLDAAAPGREPAGP